MQYCYNPPEQDHLPFEKWDQVILGITTLPPSYPIMALERIWSCTLWQQRPPCRSLNEWTPLSGVTYAMRPSHVSTTRLEDSVIVCTG